VEKLEIVMEKLEKYGNQIFFTKIPIKKLGMEFTAYQDKPMPERTLTSFCIQVAQKVSHYHMIKKSY